MQLLRSLFHQTPYIALAFVLLDELVFSLSLLSSFEISERLIGINLRLAILATVLAAVVLIIDKESTEIVSRFDALDLGKGGVIDFIPPNTDSGVSQQYRDSREIKILTLVGNQFAKLGAQNALRDLFDLTRTDAVTILLGNPDSEGVQLRYKPGFGEPDTYETGPEGIRRRLFTLYEKVKELSDAERANVDIRVFDSYPTISVVAVDSELYASFYGFNLRGGDCPKMKTTKDTPIGRFLMDHFQNVYAASTPLSEWIDTQNDASES